MKFKFCLLIYAFLLMAVVKMQAQLSHIKWTTTELSPGMQGNMHENMATDNYGNTFVIYQTQNAVSFEITFRFLCFDKEGNKKWQFDNDTSLTNFKSYNLVVPTQDGGAIFLGSNMKRISSNGQLMWQEDYSLLQDASPTVAKLDANQQLVVALKYFSPPVSIEDYCIAKYSIANGAKDWHQLIPDASPVAGEYLTDEIIDLEIDTNNDIWALGLSGNTFINIFQERLFKVSSLGILQWNNLVSTTTLNSIFNAFCIDQRNHAHLTGTLNFNQAQMQTISPSGSFFPLSIYQRDSAQTNGYDVVTDSLSNVFEVSKFRYWIPDTTFTGGQWCKYNYVLRKIDSMGVQQWANPFLITPQSFDLGYGYPIGMVYAAPHIYVASQGRFNIQQSEQNFIANKIDSNGNQVWFQASPNVSNVSKGNLLAKDTMMNVYAAYSAQDQFPAPLTGTVHRYSDSLVYTLVTSTSAFVKAKPIGLYWWTANEWLHIGSHESLEGVIELFSLGGTLIQQLSYSGLSIRLPCQQMAKGIYIIRLITKTGSGFVKVQL